MGNHTLSESEQSHLLRKAVAVGEHAYAPYSKRSIGAALLTENGAIFSGCNVENSSYGLTICAERAAVFAAVAGEGSGMRIRAMAVLNKSRVPCSPCGACRQVILEFGPRAIVLFEGADGLEEMPATELLPEGSTDYALPCDSA